jgi:hypothetical protein
MAAMLPPNKPLISKEKLLELLAPHMANINQEDLYLVGIRGYYRNTMGIPGQNDRGIYDDAMILVSPFAYAAFNANTDPSIARTGIASLKPGLYPVYRFDMHRPEGGVHHEAICQRAGKVTVIRDGTPPREDTGSGFGINIHRGRVNTTSSEGCQTIHPSQWDAFYSLAKEQCIRINGAAKFRTTVLTYILIENNGEI